MRQILTVCCTTRSWKGTWSEKYLKLLSGDMCSSTLKPLMLQSATDKTSEGKVTFTKATSVPRGPSSTLKRRCSGMVSVGEGRREGDQRNERRFNQSMRRRNRDQRNRVNSPSVTCGEWGISGVVMGRRTLYLVSWWVDLLVQSNSSMGSMVKEVK